MGIRDLFIERLKKALSEENYKLDDYPDGPAVAFAVNGSRLESDLKRDLKNGEQFDLGIWLGHSLKMPLLSSIKEQDDAGGHQTYKEPSVQAREGEAGQPWLPLGGGGRGHPRRH